MHRGTEAGAKTSGLVVIAILVAVVYALAAALFAGDRDTGTPEQIAARSASTSAVDPVGGGVAALAVVPVADEASSHAIYNKACIACHANGATNAPELGDKAAWEPRLAQGIDRLLQAAIDGKGTMPPRGTCMDCSDDDLKAAIEYMLLQTGYEPTATSDAGAPRSVENLPTTKGTSASRGPD